jgi:hypothetical protein
MGVEGIYTADGSRAKVGDQMGERVSDLGIIKEERRKLGNCIIRSC